MKTQIVDITKEQYNKIKQIVDAKIAVSKKIKEGKFSEIQSVKFVKPL
jgi:hypothetical protein